MTDKNGIAVDLALIEVIRKNKGPAVAGKYEKSLAARKADLSRSPFFAASDISLAESSYADERSCYPLRSDKIESKEEWIKGKRLYLAEIDNNEVRVFNLCLHIVQRKWSWSLMDAITGSMYDLFTGECRSGQMKITAIVKGNPREVLLNWEFDKDINDCLDDE